MRLSLSLGHLCFLCWLPTAFCQTPAPAPTQFTPFPSEAKFLSESPTEGFAGDSFLGSEPSGSDNSPTSAEVAGAGAGAGGDNANATTPSVPGQDQAPGQDQPTFSDLVEPGPVIVAEQNTTTQVPGGDITATAPPADAPATNESQPTTPPDQSTAPPEQSGAEGTAAQTSMPTTRQTQGGDDFQEDDDGGQEDFGEGGDDQYEPGEPGDYQDYPGNEFGEDDDDADEWGDFPELVTEAPKPYIPPSGEDPYAETTDESQWQGEDWPQESPEEMMHDKNVILAIALSVLFGLALAIFTAQQMIENPDGFCASICRCSSKFFCFFVRIICFPFTMCCGSKNQMRRTHDPMYGDQYTHDLELT